MLTEVKPQLFTAKLITKNMQQGAYLSHHQMDHMSYYKQFSEDYAHTLV